MISRQLFKKMVGEVSTPILFGLIADAAQKFADESDVTDKVAEQIEMIEVICGELNGRKPKEEKRKKKAEEKPQSSPAVSTGLQIRVGEGQ